jgi:hypothetical protein
MAAKDFAPHINLSLIIFPVYWLVLNVTLTPFILLGMKPAFGYPVRLDEILRSKA